MTWEIANCNSLPSTGPVGLVVLRSTMLKLACAVCCWKEYAQPAGVSGEMESPGLGLPGPAHSGCSVPVVGRGMFDRDIKGDAVGLAVLAVLAAVAAGVWVVNDRIHVGSG